MITSNDGYKGVVEMSLYQEIGSFLERGGRASQFELARMYGATNNQVRAAIHQLRCRGVAIAKTVMRDRPNESYYHISADMVIARRGRPSHKFAVTPFV
jgi:hypothetical protein